MDKILAWLWLADAVGSACQYAQELLTLYPDPAELYDALRAGTEAPPACLTPHALAQLQDTTPFDYEEQRMARRTERRSAYIQPRLQESAPVDSRR